jgi:hypothetical protein
MLFDICLEGLRKRAEYLGQDSRSPPGRDENTVYRNWSFWGKSTFRNEYCRHLATCHVLFSFCTTEMNKSIC